MSSTIRPVKGGGTACTESTTCPRQASFRISIKGALADRADPAYACNRHAPMVLRRMCAISNDIHVRGMVNVRTVDTV